MTPEARVAAAIDILDDILDGAPAEKALTTWARQHRFAGSGDRAAIRDHVFDALRQRRSFGWLGGGETGRALMIGMLKIAGQDLDTFFNGKGYGPPPLTEAERSSGQPLSAAPASVQLDTPDWLFPHLETSLGDTMGPVMEALKSRAPVFLRVNQSKGTVEQAVDLLAADEIGAEPHPLSPTALNVTRNPRRVQNAQAYLTGLVELQDVASQAVVDRLLPRVAGKSVLDYCAGGGGKSLALAAGGAGRVTAHDADPRRMADLPKRALRAGADIGVASKVSGVFDMVFCDAPCSGSGAWRRQPDAKWRLTQERLDELCRTQAAILDQALNHVSEGGYLAYATCSMLACENQDQVTAFLSRHADWMCDEQCQFSPVDGGDGFFLSVFRLKTN